jgi:mRNA-degrading endonuclease HigB of HigAB toxin-antitoxin module
VALTIKGIPERYHPGLTEIVALPIETVEAVAQALAKVEPARGTKELVSSVEHAAQIPNEKADAIITSLRSLYVLKASSEAAVPELVAKLITAMQTSGKKALQVVEQEKGDLETKLTRLLNLESLGTFSKIEQLKSDHHSLFYDAKILTDLRPVFDQPEQLPLGAIISHTLKIVCHEGIEHKELYFSLDSEDISMLKKMVERAETKMASLKTLIRTANLIDFS